MITHDVLLAGDVAFVKNFTRSDKFNKPIMHPGHLALNHPTHCFFYALSSLSQKVLRREKELIS